jgi:hypothetical protein
MQAIVDLDPNSENFGALTPVLGVDHVVRISKEAGRQLNDDKMRQQVDSLVASVNTVQRQQRGWRIELRLQGYNRGWYEQSYQTGNNGYVYHVAVRVSCAKQSDKTTEAYFANMLKAFDIKGASFPGNPWTVSQVDGEDYAPSTPTAAETDAILAAEIGYVPIQMPDEWESYFEELYGLDAHIARIRRSLSNAIATGFQSRVNTVLVGPPGCGKSHICQLVKAALGEEAVLEFDATSTTMAGAQKELAEREELPRVLIVEEIEKAPGEAMQWLLSILDLRGEIRKTTAKGNIMRDTKMVAIATVNDYELFKRQMAGALASRFSNKVHFQRPSRMLLEKVLEREVRKFDGKTEWIAPALDFAEEIGTTDPREVIAIMLCGRDDLLDGSYQKDMRETGEPEWNLPKLP